MYMHIYIYIQIYIYITCIIFTGQTRVWELETGLQTQVARLCRGAQGWKVPLLVRCSRFWGSHSAAALDQHSPGGFDITMVGNKGGLGQADCGPSFGWKTVGPVVKEAVWSLYLNVVCHFGPVYTDRWEIQKIEKKKKYETFAFWGECSQIGAGCKKEKILKYTKIVDLSIHVHADVHIITHIRALSEESFCADPNRTMVVDLEQQRVLPPSRVNSKTVGGRFVILTVSMALKAEELTIRFGKGPKHKLIVREWLDKS